MHVDLLRFPARLVLQTTVLELSDEFLLLGVNGDDRPTDTGMLSGLPGQIAELRVAVGMLTTFDDLGVALCGRHPEG